MPVEKAHPGSLVIPLKHDRHEGVAGRAVVQDQVTGLVALLRADLRVIQASQDLLGVHVLGSSGAAAETSADGEDPGEECWRSFRHRAQHSAQAGGSE
jgi:hypothetical protein